MQQMHLTIKLVLVAPHLNPTAKLNVAGIVSATAFYGDGSNLEGVASAGLGTALGEANGLEVIYYTDNVLSIGANVTVDPPASTVMLHTLNMQKSLLMQMLT